ncbi:TfuA-like protein [Streptomyces clavifer]
MGRGVHVIGAASIGALRAAELAPYGMLGVGSVYAAYHRGDITADDEVAVGQAPDGQWEALTWPLVNLRSVLRLAQEAGAQVSVSPRVSRRSPTGVRGPGRTRRSRGAGSRSGPAPQC